MVDLGGLYRILSPYLNGAPVSNSCRTFESSINCSMKSLYSQKSSSKPIIQHLKRPSYAAGHVGGGPMHWCNSAIRQIRTCCGRCRVVETGNPKSIPQSTSVI